ncbi:hypothetical protein VTJ83DRAFT_3816 [Remersonia thermophila]|uniref:Membrane insertase YidC/Oxa/ALB C-terminal domain-containing protein n=1 Tax=Remersonia thermophila TaxID=72144 RepID=A0ABR4DF40_9PEZI
MLPSRGILRSSPVLGLARTTLPKTSPRPFPRHFSTALQSSRAARHGASTTRRIGGPLAFTAASQQLFALGQARNASTQSTTPPAAPADPSALPDVSATPLELSGSDLLNIPEQIGFLKTLGLDFGWGPTSLMQTVLESIYVYTGLPWWASIAAVALAVRLVLIKPQLDASENALRYQSISKDPRYIAAMEEMKHNMIAGNHLAAAQSRAKVQLLNKEGGYSMLKGFIPLIQLPLGIGMFRLIKGMSALPVPSLETGGLFWFTDLTIADPYFILPIATGIMMSIGMRIPLPFMAEQQQKMVRMMSLIVIPLSTVVAVFLPSGITWYFLVSAVLHTIQTWLMHQAWFRRLTGLRRLEVPAPKGAVEGTWQAPRVLNASAPRVGQAVYSAPRPASESMFDSLKKSLNDAKKAMNERADRTEAERARKAAQEYEQKRSLEEKEQLLARIERQRRRNQRH